MRWQILETIGLLRLRAASGQAQQLVGVASTTSRETHLYHIPRGPSAGRRVGYIAILNIVYSRAAYTDSDYSSLTYSVYDTSRVASELNVSVMP